jgi:hypothetical protein
LSRSIDYAAWTLDFAQQELFPIILIYAARGPRQSRGKFPSVADIRRKSVMLGSDLCKTCPKIFQQQNDLDRAFLFRLRNSFGTSFALQARAVRGEPVHLHQCKRESRILAVTGPSGASFEEPTQKFPSRRSFPSDKESL